MQGGETALHGEYKLGTESTGGTRARLGNNTIHSLPLHFDISFILRDEIVEHLLRVLYGSNLVLLVDAISET